MQRAAHRRGHHGDAVVVYTPGGYDAIAAVTDALLARLLKDPQLGGFWKGHCEDSLRRDRQLVVNYMCTAAGVLVFYTGR